MKINEKEAKLISSGKLKAILRWDNQPEKVGDALFTVEGQVYVLKEKKRKVVHVIAAKRSNIDFGCEDVLTFRNMFSYLYSDYKKSRNDIVYEIIFEVDKSQVTLVGYNREL